MFSVIFEVHPKKERFDDYLDLAKHLKPILGAIDGFVDNERFESKRRPGWILSHSTWRDEKSVVRWRSEGEHHRVQGCGRSEIFEDYHLRVGDVTSDTAPPPAAPIREQRLDETETGKAKLVTFTEVTLRDGAILSARVDLVPAHLGLDTSNDGVVEYEVFASLTSPDKMALLVSWKTADSPAGWRPSRPDSVADLRHRTIRVVRDYGMFDRREAPQFYPEVAAPPA